MFQTKVVREKIKTKIVSSITVFESSAVYETMWKNMVDTVRPQLTIQNGTCPLHAGYLTLQTHTQNTYTYSFSLQQWLNESASMLRYT